MNIVTLNTEDYRCPEVMIQVRRFLSKSLDENNACEIITIEPSSLRDIPFYCAHQGFYVHEKNQLDNGTYRFLISKTDAPIQRHDSAVNIVNINEDKLSRDKELYTVYESVVAELYALLEAGVLLTIPASFGKDSKLVLTAALDAHERAIQNGVIDNNHPFIVIHIDTGIESIPMLMYSLFAMMKLEKYCAQKGINLSLHHQRPDLQFQFASLFIGARKLPSTPQLNSDCAVIMKVDVSQAIQKKLIAKYGQDKLVSCIGSRHQESVNRSQSLKKFGNDKQTALSLIQKKEKGISTFAPIRDLSNEEVFELLQRMGTDPMIMPSPGCRMPAYMPSYRLLIQIYGDSANDTCEINMGDDSQKVACGGSARNGCLNCFKAGKVDKSVVAHNRYKRWSVIQGNANKVRDFMFSIAHDVNFRTHHPRAFDPVTNYAMLQPNILSSRALERLLTYFVQLTHDDYLRAQEFRKLLDNGQLTKDEGYLEIINDQTFFDEKTRNEFLEMYVHGASQQLIKTATLEHCLFLSAQWAMDGVKSLPFRPLAIYDSVVRKGRRIPYPNVDTSNAPLDNIGDAMGIKISEAGVDLLSLHTAPFRIWDVIESDMDDGCSTVSIPNKLRVAVTYSKIGNKEVLRVVNDGVSINLGDNTRNELLEIARKRYQSSDQSGPVSFSQFLSYRKLVTVGHQLRGMPTQKNPIKNATARLIKRTAKGITRTKTSLRMYAPQVKSSLSSSYLKEVKVWVPDVKTKKVPYLTQHQNDINEETVNFELSDNLVDWIDYGGYEKALAMHDEHLMRSKRRRYLEDGKQTLRRFTTTQPFWTLLQDGVISVNNNTWYTAQKTLQRTEIFLEAGLFLLPNSKDSLIMMDGVVDMATHRNIKFNELLTIRKKRNEDRRRTKALIKNVNNEIERSLTTRIEQFSKQRQEVLGNDAISIQLLCAGGEKSFDSFSFVVNKKLMDDWYQEYKGAFENIDSMLSVIASKHEIDTVNNDLDVKLNLARTLEAHNVLFINEQKRELDNWGKVVELLPVVQKQNIDGLYNERLLELCKQAMPTAHNINVAIAMDFLAQKLTYNKCSLLSFDNESSFTDEWHTPFINEFKSTYLHLKESINLMPEKQDMLVKITSDARNGALMNFF
ncbi:sulfurtransferase TusA family protein (plasmid) [Alteromonas macleodii]|uniref:sulfurtransferase TusA family protein n=1 Tax=Alteromonas macleodii TaxID=28108 RepID=UPI0030D24EDF